MLAIVSTSKIKDWPEDERPREKLMHRGAEALSDAELLAIFLRTGTPGSGGLDQGYLVNYDITTGQISDFKTYNYNNEPISALVSHFDGITATETGFHLTGDYATIGGETGGFFASVDVLPGGGFGEAEWTRIAFPGADLTSGNTVVEDSVLGIYISGGTALSYVATVPEPGTITLLLLGSGYLLVRGYRRQ